MGHTVVLISKAGSDEKEDKARLWLAHYNYDDVFDSIKFCRTQEGKIDICRAHHIDVMVDDTERQLHLLAGIVTYRILFGSTVAPEGMIAAQDWRAMDRAVLALPS
jgi:hypothetical protein